MTPTQRQTERKATRYVELKSVFGSVFVYILVFSVIWIYLGGGIL